MKDINWKFEDDETDDFIHPDFIDHKDFYNFLIDNNALNNYIKNFENDEFFKRNKSLKKFLNISNKLFINFAFTWIETPEGYDFWDMLNKRLCVQFGYSQTLNCLQTTS